VRVALVTSAAYVDIDDELPLLPPALSAVGLESEVVSWDDSSVDWASFDGAVIRSTWDYIDRLDEFLAWTDAVENQTRLANPAAVVRWNSSKRYLKDLAAAGVPTVPTVWPADGDAIPQDWVDIVVKPAVSAGSRQTGRYRDRAAALAFVGELAATGADVLVQPYLPSVDEEGEIAVFFFGGAASHAARKGPILQPGADPVSDYALVFQQSREPLDLEAAPTTFARSVLETVPQSSSVLYARVDCVADGSGGEVLLEVEMVEPSLFLVTSDGAAGRFASAVADWLSKSG
jgi:glutathione synthase/RimK-type ligase-like ATP-grasp enzyme